ncbi:MOXD1 homolog 2-like [Paramacrobiotus metropolitanus]|uniref:MOXD1 homolog 2-like n=1 Tax=Paramacrobiotus metropolitanus TaxID=2943436 RepID=UPI0024456EDB|nr:MOXD1 homolog 2-like [Paramacrobiotus metropolitanus]
MEHFPGGGITLTSVQHTTNSYGIQIRTRLIRDGKEVKVISEDFAHTSAFQPFRDIDHVQILPGDRILLECTYNTSRVLSDTAGGYGSNNEAYSAIFSYYPRIAGFQFCGSTPELRHIQALRNVARAGTNTGSVPTLSRSESALLQQYPTPSNTADNAPYGSLAMGTYGPNTVPVLDRNVAAPVSSNPDQCAQSRAQNLYLYHRHEPVCELETPELFRVDSIDMLPVLSDPQCPNVMIQRNISYVWPLECYDIVKSRTRRSAGT